MRDIDANNYTNLLNEIGQILTEGRVKAFHAVDDILVQTYWNIGRRIVEHEQQGQEKAEYGSRLLKDLSRDLKTKYGKGFSRSNLQYMRLLYIKYPICQTLSGKLSWSHYSELLSISDDLSRSFYEKQSINENWSVRELKRQRQTGTKYSSITRLEGYPISYLFRNICFIFPIKNSLKMN